MEQLVSYRFCYEYEVLRGEPTKEQIKAIFNKMTPLLLFQYRIIGMTGDSSRFTEQEGSGIRPNEWHESWEIIIQIRTRTWNANAE